MSTNVFEIEINDFDNTGMWANSFVDEPANRMAWHYFGQQKPIYFTNDEERIVTGVAIRANQLVPRYDNELGKYFVVFKPHTVKHIAQKFFEKNNVHAVNEQHNPNKIMSGVYLFESFLIDRTKGIAPERFEDAPDGSWVVSYKIKNDAIWSKVKAGTFNGLSIEGLFEHKNVKIKQNIKMKNQKSIREILFGVKPTTAHNFAQATTTDGVVVFWDGELTVGATITVDVEGEMLPAPEGTHILVGEGVEGVAITVDASGVITEVVLPEVNEDTTTEMMEAIIEEVKSVKTEMAQMREAFNAVIAENEALKLKVEEFGAQPRVEPVKKVEPVNVKTNMHPVAMRYLNK
jgi:hypothetical protein